MLRVTALHIGADFMSAEAQSNVTRSSAARVREHRRRERRDQWPFCVGLRRSEPRSYNQSSSSSRRTAGAAGFLIFSQWSERPGR